VPKAAVIGCGADARRAHPFKRRLVDDAGDGVLAPMGIIPFVGAGMSRLESSQFS
jgi:hypothetical protein